MSTTLTSAIWSLQPIGAGAADLLVEAQLAPVLQRVLGLDEGAGRVVEQIVEAGQQEAQRTAPRPQRQSGPLPLRQRGNPSLAGEEVARFWRGVRTLPVAA